MADVQLHPHHNPKHPPSPLYPYPNNCQTPSKHTRHTVHQHQPGSRPAGRSPVYHFLKKCPKGVGQVSLSDEPLLVRSTVVHVKHDPCNMRPLTAKTSRHNKELCQQYII